MKKFIILIMLMSIYVFLTSCSGEPDDSEMTEVRIAYFPNITHAQGLVMKSEGLLEDKLDGIGVKWISFNAGPSEVAAMLSGKIDIGYIGPVPAVSGYIKSDGNIRIIAGAANGGSVLLSKRDSNIRGAADLNGKDVAVPQLENTQHADLLRLLRANGLAPASSGGTVNVIQASNSDIVDRIEKGRIDAAFVPEPWGSILELRYGAKLVLDYDEIDADCLPATAVVIVRKDFLDEHEDIVKMFIEAHKEATAYINENNASDIIYSQIADTTQSLIDAEVLKRAFKRLEITYEIPAVSIMDFAETSVDEGLLSELPGDDIIDDRFI